MGRGKDPIGFNFEQTQQNENENILIQVVPADLIKFGFKPEFVGRYQTIARLHRLTLEHKIQILKESKDAVINDYHQYLTLKKYILDIPDETLKVIVGYCPETTGARALDSICSNLFTEILYDPKAFTKGNIITVTPELARELITLPEPNK